MNILKELTLLVFILSNWTILVTNKIRDNDRFVHGIWKQLLFCIMRNHHSNNVAELIRHNRLP